MSHRTPPITINGYPLDQCTAECLRAAVTAFHSEMSEDSALGDDGHGHRMASAYRTAMESVLELMGVIQAKRS